MQVNTVNQTEFESMFGKIPETQENKTEHSGFGFENTESIFNPKPEEKKEEKPAETTSEVEETVEPEKEEKEESLFEEENPQTELPDFGKVKGYFEEYIKEDLINPKAGTKIDVKLEPASAFQPGLVVSVSLDKKSGSKFITVVLDGMNSKTFDIPYPNKERISPCGTYIKGRKCLDTELNNDNKSIFIRFITKDYNIIENSFTADYGEEYGKNGKQWGWNRNVSKLIKQKSNILLSSPELETYIEFPPSESSILCNNPSNSLICEPINWFIKVGKGVFVVKLFIGDPQNEFKSNFIVNNKLFSNGELFEKNKLYTIEKHVEDINEFITITSQCSTDCDYNYGRLNAIKITTYEVFNKELKDSKDDATPCGNGFKGGKCLFGPDVLHCIFNDPTVVSASYCHGDKVLKAIPNDYMCKDQIGHFKCVRKSYINEDECRLYCPSKCENEKCSIN